MEKIIKRICGIGGDLEELKNISNDPNFVFVPDPLFETVTLYNSDGKIINVNSWLECANYVNGGWINENISMIEGEKLIFYFCSILIIIYLSMKRYIDETYKNK